MHQVSSTSNFKEKQKFSIKFLLLLLIIAIFDLIIGKSCDFMFKNSMSGRYGLLNKVITDKPDILILGTSRAAHHYIPQVIAKDTNLTCMNIGSDGSNVIYHLSEIKYILNHYTPKLLIYDIIGQEFDKEMDVPARYEEMYPIIRKDTSLLNIVKDNDKNIKLKMCSHIFPYSGKIIKLLKSFFIKSNFKGYGYRPLYGSDIDIVLKTEKKYNYFPSNEKKDLIKAFKQLLSYLNDKKIQTIFVNSPQWHYIDGTSKYNFSSTLNEIIKKNKKKNWIINANTYKILDNSLLYKDLAHLNDNGARIFSHIINKKLKNYLTKDPKCKSQN